MVKEIELFKLIQQGEYSRMPKTMYNLLILVANNLQQNTLVIHSDRRPTVIEAVIANYNFMGITTSLKTDIKKVESLFNKSYVITVNVSEFLSGIQSFNQIAMGTLLDEETLLAQEAKRQRNLSKKEKENEKTRIIYRRNIKQEPLCDDEQQESNNEGGNA